MLSLAGSGAETAPYEQAVSLIGKAWRLTAEETSEQLALIEQEKAVMGRIENGESAEHIRQELLLNWSGLESIEVLEGLFETSTLLLSLIHIWFWAVHHRPKNLPSGLIVDEVILEIQFMA